MKVYFGNANFRAEKVDKIVQPVISEWHKTFLFVEKIEQLANDQLYCMRVDDNDIKKVLAAALYFEIYHFFQAVHILAKKGGGVNCAPVALSMLEAVMSLRILSSEKSHVQETLIVDKTKTVRLMDALINGDNQNFNFLTSQLNIKKLQKHKSQLQKEIAKKGAGDLSLSELARQADMVDFHKYACRIFSHQEFATAESFVLYAQAGEQGQITECENGLPPRDVQLILSTTAYMLLASMDSIDRIFELDLGYALASWMRIFE